MQQQRDSFPALDGLDRTTIERVRSRLMGSRKSSPGSPPPREPQRRPEADAFEEQAPPTRRAQAVEAEQPVSVRAFLMRRADALVTIAGMIVLTIAAFEIATSLGLAAIGIALIASVVEPPKWGRLWRRGEAGES